MNKQFKGILSLFTAVMIWGSTFVAQSVGMDFIGPFTFQAVRCGMGVVFLTLLAFCFDLGKKEGRQFLKKWANPKLWKAGAICGTVLFVAAGLQQAGLVYTTAGKAGFITALYIVFVPIIGLFLRRTPCLADWISVAIAVVGLYLLSAAGVTEVNIGDVMLVFSAIAFAVQITCVDRMAGDLDELRMNCIQCLFCSGLSAVAMFLLETPELANIISCWFPLAYAGILSMGIGYSLQIVGQKNLEPTDASLIMSLESVIAALCGWLILHEVMSGKELLGCVLVFGAVILSQLPLGRQKKINIELTPEL